MTATALLGIIKDSRPALAFFDFAPRIPEPTDAERVVWAMQHYEGRRYELYDVSRQEAVEEIRRLLDEATENDPHLATYIRASGDLGIDRHIPMIATHRDNPDPKVQLAVIRAFGQLAAIDYAPWLAAFARHPLHELRREAAIALGKIAHESVPPLLDVFGSADPALLPVVSFGKEKIACLVDHPSEASAHRMVRLELGSDAYEDLVPKVLYVAKALVNIAEDSAAPGPLRARAVRVLGLSRVAPVATTYLKLLERGAVEPEELRYEAIVALGGLRMRGADTALLEQVRTAEPRLRRAALFALGRIGKASTIEPLLESWDVEGGALRSAIYAALRAIAKTDGAPVLASALSNDRPAPSDVLVFVDEHSFTRTLRVDEVEAHLRSPVVDARRDAALLYAYFGPPERAFLLHELAARETDPEIKTIAERGGARLDREAGGPDSPTL